MSDEHILDEWDITKAYGILEKLRKYCKERGGNCRGCQLINEDDPPYNHYCYLRNGLADWIHAEYWEIMNAEKKACRMCEELLYIRGEGKVSCNKLPDEHPDTSDICEDYCKRKDKVM